MAGSLTLSADGIVVHSVALDGTQGDIELAWRNKAKALNYTGDADVDAIALIGEFLCLNFAQQTDVGYLVVDKSEGQTALDVAAAAAVSKQTIGATSTV